MRLVKDLTTFWVVLVPALHGQLAVLGKPLVVVGGDLVVVAEAGDLAVLAVVCLYHP
jgi:hypothetical protein